MGRRYKLKTNYRRYLCSHVISQSSRISRISICSLDTPIGDAYWIRKKFDLIKKCSIVYDMLYFNLFVLQNPGESSTLSLNSYDQECLNNELQDFRKHYIRYW
ncbi:hypothetical protein Glove_13g27 [Diversispora epigaea]|uniref:Uncharacterized protein n=1 Tax=Diversispora epigaea TaxID=1348612 RepID=A0A397JQF7_9GLOM|nr:hypothetical protein Glove_13g27 [Diversispora epigaea]